MFFNSAQAQNLIRAGLYDQAELLINQEAQRFEPTNQAIQQRLQGLTLPKLCRYGTAFISESLITSGMINLAGKTYKIAKVGSIRLAQATKECAKQAIEGFGARELAYVTPEGLLIQIRDKSLNLAQRTARNTAGVTGKKTASREIILPKVKTFEQARNKALEIIGDLGPNSSAFIGSLPTSKGCGKTIGRMSCDNKLRWYLDYDPIKGPHINVHNFRLGKGINAKRYAIPFSGTEATFEALLRHMNR